NENFDFYSRTLRGVQQLPPRWKRCVSLVDRQLGEALGQEFVQRAFGADMKRRTLEMTEQIERAMENDIKQLTWMSDATKQQALPKLHGLRNKVGYPDKWRDYSSVEIRRGDFLGNVQRATVFESRRELNKIGKPVDRTEWGMTPPTVNAYYNSHMNEIVFPAGILQPPFFHPKADDAVNYGGMGAVIGHEMTHGFDDQGRQFDAAGNLRDWWSPESSAKYKERLRASVQQYSEYEPLPGAHVNGVLTQGE